MNGCIGTLSFFLDCSFRKKVLSRALSWEIQMQTGATNQVGNGRRGGADSGGPFLHSNDRIEPKKTRILSKEIRGKG